MSATAVRTPAEYEARLQRYYFERSEEARENASLAARVTFRGEEMPLRAAEARLAVLDAYADREELGELEREESSRLNPDRLALMTAWETLDAELSGEPDPVARTEEEK